MAGDDDPKAALRQIDDAATFRALTHPVRIALLEVLGIQGPMTATEAGERIGESPTTCSFHLRQLARYGFVEEAGGGKGRARPWRMTSTGMNISEAAADTETQLAAQALGRLLRQRQLARFEQWQESKGHYPAAWRSAAFDSSYVLYLTPAELEQLEEELSRLLLPLHRERRTDPATRPPDALPVEVLTFGYPMAPPRDAS